MTAASHSRVRSLVAVLLALGAVACGSDSPADPSRTPAALSAESPRMIDATVGGTVSDGVSVLVLAGDGRPVGGVPVSFAVTAGGGKIERPSARTNGRGIASSGPWTLGTTAGTQRIVARVARLDSVDFVASVDPGAPASVAAMSVAASTGTVGTQMAAPPSVVVRDQYSNPVPGVAVTFEVRSGGGVATGTSTVTDANGTATLGSLRLGTRSGRQEIVAHVAGLPETMLAVDAVAGPAQILRLVSGSDQIATVGSYLDIAPRISVRDGYNNPVARRTVSARVTAGGGSMAGGLLTDDAGDAVLDRWTLGSSEGLNAIALDVDGLPTLTIYAKAVPVSSFNIQFRYLSAVSDQQRAAFERAATRWKKVIVGDVVDIMATRASFCGLQNSALNEVIDDLIIFVELVPIDGPGKVLGSAGPCSIRAANGIPHVGAMRFDMDDVTEMEAQGRFDDVVLHEIGHILGIGTMWTFHQLLVGAGGDDPHYIGESGRAGFLSAGGSLYNGIPVPVENSGGPGTRDGHWRESVLNAEVMTGFVEQPGIRMPLSLLTIGTLEDMGYLITVWGDDPYTYGGAPLLSGAIPRRPATPDRELIEVPFPPPEVATSSGQSSPISARIARPPARQRRVMSVQPRPVQQLEVRRPD